MEWWKIFIWSVWFLLVFWYSGAPVFCRCDLITPAYITWEVLAHQYLRQSRYLGSNCWNDQWVVWRAPGGSESLLSPWKFSSSWKCLFQSWTHCQPMVWTISKVTAKCQTCSTCTPAQKAMVPMAQVWGAADLSCHHASRESKFQVKKLVLQVINTWPLNVIWLQCNMNSVHGQKEHWV